MATVTLRLAQRFPAGTTVAAYPKTNWSFWQLPPTGAPQGSAATSAAAATDGTVTFEGLVADTSYFAYALVDGQHRYVSFNTAASSGPVRDLSQVPWFDAKSEFGARGDGVTDDRLAIEAARDAAEAAGGGVVYVPEGVYVSTGQITEWPDKVSLVGAGRRRTVFRPTGANFRWMFVTRTAVAPLTGCEFRDFELDGSQISSGAATKGVHIAHYRDCVFDNLYIHDCGMTGLGPDHPQGHNVISNNFLENNGRLNSGAESSGNGIGVGMADTSSEQPVAIFGNTCIGNKRYGILIESQSGVASQLCAGARIFGNYCAGSQVGIGDCGTRRSVIANNQCTNNSVAGIAADEGTFSGGQPGYNGRIAENVCYANVGDGIRLDYSVGTVIGCQTTVQNNECSHNTGRGIHVLSAAQDIFDLVVQNNVCRFNARTGILFALTGAATAQLRWSEVVGNFCMNNGTASSANDGDGIRVNMVVNDTTIEDNRCFDRQGTKTQDRGIHLNAAVNGGSVRNNDVRNNQTGGMTIVGALSTTTAIGSNLGHTPPAPVSVTPAASPWTYTAGDVPEWLILHGGTVSSVTLGGVSIAASSNVIIPLEPADAPVITYSVVPTARTRRRS